MKKLLTLLITLLGLYYCKGQTNLKIGFTSSFRETGIIKGLQSTDTIIDNSLKYELYFVNNDKKRGLISKEIIEYSANHKATSDTVLVSKSDKRKIKLVNEIDFDSFNNLFDLAKQESKTNYGKQKVLSTTYDLSIELVKGNKTIQLKRKEHPADYVNYWYCNGKEIFNPKIDEIVSKIFPKITLGDYKLLKTPSKKTTKYHKNELIEILKELTNCLKIKDSINLKKLIYKLSPNINTVQYFENNKLYYRGIPEAFEGKSINEAQVMLKKGRDAYYLDFQRFLNKIEPNSEIELLTVSNDINVEYSGFLKDFRGHSKIILPRGNGAIETTHFYFKWKINGKTREYSFGEMLRVNGIWKSFTAPRI